MTASPAVEWCRLDQPVFDRIVEGLIRREFKDSWDIEARNGRGGDEGIDVAGRQGNRLRIWQLKYFPGGFPVKERGRRKQIEKSFTSAMKLDVTEWTLVVPDNLTASERAFISKLPVDAGIEGVAVSVWGRVELDDMMAKYPDLTRFLRADDPVRELMEQLGQEKMTPRSLPELGERLRSVALSADGMDPDWGVDFARSGDMETFIIRPRHSHAHETSPIRINFNAVFGPEESEIEESFKRVLGYGVPETLNLPATAIQDLKITGPAFLQQRGELHHLELRPIGDVGSRPRPVKLTLRDDTGAVSVHEGTVEHITHGHLGVSLDLEFYGGLEMQMLLPSPHRADEHCAVNVSTSVLEGLPEMHRITAQLVEQLYTSATVELEVNGHRVATLAVNDDEYGDERVTELRMLQEAAGDLAFIQDQTAVRFPMPSEIRGIDRAMMRCISLMLRGRLVRHPTRTSVDMTVLSEAARQERLEPHLRGEPMAVSFTCPHPVYELDEHRIKLPLVQFWSPSVIIQDTDTVRTLLTEGKETHATIATTDGTTMCCCMPDRLVREPDGHVETTPWGLIGIDEIGSPSSAKSLPGYQPDNGQAGAVAHGHALPGHDTPEQ